MAATSLGRGQMRPHNAGRTPSFVVIGLMIVIAILGFNYWSVSSKNSMLAREVNENRDRIRVSAVKKIALEKRNDALMQRVRATDLEIDQHKLEGSKKNEEVDDLKRRIETVQQQDNFRKSEKEQIQKELDQCKEDKTTQLESADTCKQTTEECYSKLKDMESKWNNQAAQVRDCAQSISNERMRILKLVYKEMGEKAYNILQTTLFQSNDLNVNDNRIPNAPAQGVNSDSFKPFTAPVQPKYMQPTFEPQYVPKQPQFAQKQQTEQFLPPPQAQPDFKQVPQQDQQQQQQVQQLQQQQQQQQQQTQQTDQQLQQQHYLPQSQHTIQSQKAWEDPWQQKQQQLPPAQDKVANPDSAVAGGGLNVFEPKGALPEAGNQRAGVHLNQSVDKDSVKSNFLPDAKNHNITANKPSAMGKLINKLQSFVIGEVSTSNITTNNNRSADGNQAAGFQNKEADSLKPMVGAQGGGDGGLGPKPPQGAEGQLGAPAYNVNLQGYRQVAPAQNVAPPPQGDIGIVQQQVQQQQPQQPAPNVNFQITKVRDVQSDIAQEQVSPVGDDHVSELGPDNGDVDEVIDHDRLGVVADGDVNAHEHQGPEANEDFEGGQDEGPVKDEAVDTRLKFHQGEQQLTGDNRKLEGEIAIEQMRQQRQQQDGIRQDEIAPKGRETGRH